MKKGFFHRWKKFWNCVLVWVLPRPNEHLGKEGVNEQVPGLVSRGVILLGASERL